MSVKIHEPTKPRSSFNVMEITLPIALRGLPEPNIYKACAHAQDFSHMLLQQLLDNSLLKHFLSSQPSTRSVLLDHVIARERVFFSRDYKSLNKTKIKTTTTTMRRIMVASDHPWPRFLLRNPSLL